MMYYKPKFTKIKLIIGPTDLQFIPFRHKITEPLQAVSSYTDGKSYSSFLPSKSYIAKAQ